MATLIKTELNTGRNKVFRAYGIILHKLVKRNDQARCIYKRTERNEKEICAVLLGCVCDGRIKNPIRLVLNPGVLLPAFLLHCRNC